MTTNCYSVTEEAIQELFHGHENVIIDAANHMQADSEYQLLKIKSDALESQLEILKGAKKAADQGCDPEPLGRGPNTATSHCSTELMKLRQRGKRVRRYWRRMTEENTPTSSQRNVAVETQILRWTQETIKSITETLTREQLDEGTDREFIPPWSSPLVTALVILSEELQKRISPLGEQLADARWRQNNLVPIARLPPEILIYVFDLVLEKGSDSRFDANILLTMLTRICRAWTRLIDNAPRLWSQISPYCSMMRHVATALAKSKAFPLMIRFEEQEMQHIRPDNFFGAIKRHAERWKVLDLELRSPQTLHIVNSRLVNVRLARLERLRVSLIPKRGEEAHPTDLTMGSWPDTLRHIHLNDVGMALGSYAELRGLRTLKIWSLPHWRAVGVAELIYAVSNCPDLEILLLYNDILLGGEPISGPPVRLDRLRELSLHLSPDLLQVFLRSIQTVNCTNFDIETMLPLQDATTAWTKVLLTHEIQPFFRTIESILLSASAISIEAHTRTVKLETRSRNSVPRVSLRFKNGQPAEVVRWMAERLTLGQAPVTLSVVAYDPMWIEILHLALSRFHSTVELILSGSKSIGQQTIDFLGTALYTDPVGYQHFPIPRLTALTVTVESIPNLMSMLERRYGQDGSTDVSSAKRIVRLSKLGVFWGKRMVARGSTVVQQVISALPGCEVKLY